ncbi:MAG TPA: hypothetical protein VLJ59_05835 [Mycobacteriales bacterium]|nr:hypothetical protein [Mycobacteriales bacterium]
MFAKKTKESATRVYVRIQRVPSGRVAAGIVVTTLVASAQGLWLFVAYVGGNLLSLNFSSTHGHRIELHSLDAVLGSLQWDAISGTYVVVAFAAIFTSYMRGRVDVDQPLVALLALPYGLAGFGLLMVLGINVLNGGLGWLLEQGFKVDGLWMVGLIVVIWLYIGSAVLATNASTLVRASWSA